MVSVRECRTSLPLVLSAWVLVACGAGAPPPELVDARKAIDKATAGPASKLAPAQLDTAKQALSKAEASFEEEGDAPITKDLAYIANVRAQIAEAEAGREQAERERAQIDKDFKEGQLDALQATKATVQKTAAQLESEKRALETEKKARADA